MGPSHSSIDSYRDDSRFSSCTTRHPTQNPLRLSGVQRFLALCSEALKSSTVEISRKSRKEDLRNYPKVLKMELLPKERSRRRSMVSTLRQRRYDHRDHYDEIRVFGLREIQMYSLLKFLQHIRRVEVLCSCYCNGHRLSRLIFPSLF